MQLHKLQQRNIQWALPSPILIPPLSYEDDDYGIDWNVNYTINDPPACSEQSGCEHLEHFYFNAADQAKAEGQEAEKEVVVELAVLAALAILSFVGKAATEIRTSEAFASMM